MMMTVFANKSGGAESVTRKINVPGAVINVTFSPDQFETSEEVLVGWVESSARAVADYYDHFPVPRLSVYIRAQGGSGIGYGSAHGSNTPYIQVNVGRESEKEEFDDDWVMTHEMTHLGFPSIKGSYQWLEEGMATYIEPLARARIGTNTAQQVWGDLIRHLPRDLPRYGSRGIHEASNYREIYWGGALFWLMADVELRKQSNNRRGLEDIFQHIVTKGGTINTYWELREVLDECDRAAGKKIFSDIYQRMSVTPIDVNVTELWQQLGVELRNNRVTFNDRAPLAKIRLAITKGSRK
jgi:hypothetical protein